MRIDGRACVDRVNSNLGDCELGIERKVSNKRVAAGGVLTHSVYRPVFVLKNVESGTESEGKDLGRV